MATLSRMNFRQNIQSLIKKKVYTCFFKSGYYCYHFIYEYLIILLTHYSNNFSKIVNFNRQVVSILRKYTGFIDIVRPSFKFKVRGRPRLRLCIIYY